MFYLSILTSQKEKEEGEESTKLVIKSYKSVPHF
jgi:hypothetical protein